MATNAAGILVGTTTSPQIVLNVLKKSLLKSTHTKTFLPNFPTPENPRIENFKPQNNRITPPPPLGQVYVVFKLRNPSCFIITIIIIIFFSTNVETCEVCI